MTKREKLERGRETKKHIKWYKIEKIPKSFTFL
jgi:hypothetical protein